MKTKSRTHRRHAGVGCLVAVTAVLCGVAEAQDRVFPYEVHRRTLSNGLDVIAIPMREFTEVVSYNTMVLVGSRNEVEPGKSGLAHLFEHIMFRHRTDDRDGGYEAAIGEMGAFNNAFTNADITYYHPLTFASNLEPLTALTADQFINLDYTEETFQTEAGAVLGEYRRVATDPGLRMREVLSRLSYGDHGYGHTTIGYLADVEDMPSEYEAAVEFYDDWYRPNNTILVIAGDIVPDEVFSLVERHYGGWTRQPVPALPLPPAVEGPKREQVEWPADVPPRVQVSYRVPRHETGTMATAVGQLVPEVLTGETSRLYRMLRFEKQTAASLSGGTGGFETFDPGTLTVTAVLFKDQYRERGSALLDEVEADVARETAELASFGSRPGAEQMLEAVVRKYEVDLAARFDSPANTARSFASLYRFERDPRIFERLVASVRIVTPADIEQYARRYFVDSGQVVVTMVPSASSGP